MAEGSTSMACVGEQLEDMMTASRTTVAERVQTAEGDGDCIRLGHWRSGGFDGKNPCHRQAS